VAVGVDVVHEHVAIRAGAEVDPHALAGTIYPALVLVDPDVRAKTPRLRDVFHRNLFRRVRCPIGRCDALGRGGFGCRRDERRQSQRESSRDWFHCGARLVSSGLSASIWYAQSITIVEASTDFTSNLA